MVQLIEGVDRHAQGPPAFPSPAAGFEPGQDGRAQTRLPPVSVVVPAYDEEHGIGAAVSGIGRVLKAHGVTYEIIVVDDGSHDGTAHEAMRASARVLRHPQNRGYGASIKTGILAANYEAIVISDADGT